jgi:hypothetical protein
MIRDVATRDSTIPRDYWTHNDTEHTDVFHVIM